MRVAAGGVATEVWQDEVHLLPPIATSDAARALRGLRLWPLLDGSAAASGWTSRRWRRSWSRSASSRSTYPRSSDLDLNPLLVDGRTGVHCVDVKVRLQASAALDAGIPRRLRLAER